MVHTLLQGLVFCVFFGQCCDSAHLCLTRKNTNPLFWVCTCVLIFYFTIISQPIQVDFGLIFGKGSKMISSPISLSLPTRFDVEWAVQINAFHLV